MAGKHTGRSTEDSTNFPWADFWSKGDKAFAEGFNGETVTGDPATSGTPAKAAYDAGAASVLGYEADAASHYTQTLGDIGEASAKITVSADAVPDATAFTLMCWVKNDGTNWNASGTQKLFQLGDGTVANSYGINAVHYQATGWIPDGYGSGYVGNNTTSSSTAGAQTGATLQHIAITFEGGAALRFYLNGVEDGSDLAGVTAVMETSASLSWTVGANHHQTTNANNMVIGDLWVGEVVATLAQIQAVYNSGVPIHPGEGGIGGPYGKLGVTPLVFLGGPGYDWTATPLANPGSLGTAVVTGTITAG